MQNAGMNFLNALGGDFGKNARTGETLAKVTPMIAGGTVADYQKAKSYATERKDLGLVQGLDAQIKAMTKEQAALASQKAQATAQLAFAGLKLPPEQQAGYIQYWGPKLGFSPEEVAQVSANPSLLQGVAAQSEDFIKTLAKNSENFTLTPGQQRFSGQGEQIAAVDPEAKVLADGAQLVGQDGSQIAENAKDIKPDAITAYQQAQLDLQRDKLEADKAKVGGGGVITLPDGTRVETGNGLGSGQGAFASPFNGNKELAKAFATKDASAITAELEKANGASDMFAKMDEMEAILDTGYQSGITAPLEGQAARLKGAVGFSTDDDDARAQSYEQMNSLSRELGADALKLFGGSDTEKELQVAIETNPGPQYTPETNRALIARKRKAVEVLASRADFMADWANTNGSLVAKNSDGETFSKAWRKYQAEQFGTAPKVSLAKGNDPKVKSDVNPLYSKYGLE